MTQPQQRINTADDSVPSPCVSVCAVLESARVCIGCFRTLDEIAEWSLLDAAGKRAVLAALPARRAALGFADDAKASPDAER
jgi:predicted Fe-S protein YdhL (DUF1289 family)